MSGFVAGPPSGGQPGAAGPSNSGPVAVVLLAAIAATLFIGVILMAVSITGGGGGGSPASVQPASAGTADQERVVLTVFLKGEGKGEVRISPGAITCGRDCEHRFPKGTRLNVTTDPADGSAFDEWDDACKGDGRCSFVIDEDRSLTVSFKPDASGAACDARARAVDPACAAAGAGEPLTRSDCHDGRDNDGDGLTDAVQDPDCDTGFEAALPAPAPPPPAAAAGDCDDGRDNDGDGLTDTKQDPDCLIGDTENGAAAAGRTSERRAPPDCGDGRDNDGDGLTDAEQDPGCDSGGTEAD